MNKDRCPKHLPRIVGAYSWKKLQAGIQDFEVEDTGLTFSATAQQVSKAVRRFNESDHPMRWPGFRFSAKVLGPYAIRISVRQVPLNPDAILQ